MVTTNIEINSKGVAQQFALYPAGVALPSRRCFWFLVFLSRSESDTMFVGGDILIRHCVTVCGSTVMLFSSFSSEVIPLSKALDSYYFCR